MSFKEEFGYRLRRNMRIAGIIWIAIIVTVIVTTI